MNLVESNQGKWLMEVVARDPRGVVLDVERMAEWLWAGEFGNIVGIDRNLIILWQFQEVMDANLTP